MDHELAKMGEQKQFSGTDFTVDLDLPDTYTIARQLQIQDNPPICVCLLLFIVDYDIIFKLGCLFAYRHRGRKY